MKFTRRTAMEVLGASALTPLAATPAAAAQVPAPPKEGKDTPKIALGTGDGGGFGGGGGRGGRVRGAGVAPPDPNTPAPDPLAGPKRIKQLGVNHVLGGGPQVPWTEENLKNVMDRWKQVDITVGNLMINLSPDITFFRFSSV